MNKTFELTTRTTGNFENTSIQVLLCRQLIRQLEAVLEDIYKLEEMIRDRISD